MKKEKAKDYFAINTIFSKIVNPYTNPFFFLLLIWHEKLKKIMIMIFWEISIINDTIRFPKGRSLLMSNARSGEFLKGLKF